MGYLRDMPKQPERVVNYRPKFPCCLCFIEDYMYRGRDDPGTVAFRQVRLQGRQVSDKTAKDQDWPGGGSSEIIACIDRAGCAERRAERIAKGLSVNIDG